MPSSPRTDRSPAQRGSPPTTEVGHRSGARPAVARAAAVVLLAAVALVACDEGDPAKTTDSNGSSSANRTATAIAATAEPVSTARLPAPGRGVVTGRLVDSVTGLAIADGGVTLLELGRRTVTGIDGSFRFDGVPAGALTLVFGPVDGFVPASLAIRPPDDGLDVGLVSLLAAEPPTLIEPEAGGAAAGCGSTEVEFPRGSLPEPAGVSVTCIEQSDALPAPPPPGRLPLASVHVAPAEIALGAPAVLNVRLPSQPRYSSGVSLDLLRLDLDRLIWVPVGSLLVDPEGAAARGTVTALGTYLAAAPPFGAFSVTGGDQPAITRINVAAAPDGPPSDVFPAGIPIVYLSLDYAHMSNTSVLVRTADRRGNLLYESSRPYADMGRDNVPMSTSDGAWSSGDYVTSVYLGDPPAAQDGIEWRVSPRATAAPAPTVAPRLPPPVRPPRAPAPVATTRPWVPAPGPPPAPTACRRPYGWFAYVVRQGDTLYSLARRTGTSVEALVRANCLPGTTVYAGQILYVPRPPARESVAPGHPTPTRGWPRSTPVIRPPTRAWPTHAVATRPFPTRAVPSATWVVPPTSPSVPTFSPPQATDPVLPPATPVEPSVPPPTAPSMPTVEPPPAPTSALPPPTAPATREA